MDLSYHKSIAFLLKLIILLIVSSPGFAQSSLIKIADRKIKDEEYVRIDSLLVYHKEKLLFENYYRGFDREYQHRTHSTFKSINSLIALIAIEKNLINERESVFKLFKYLDPDIKVDNAKYQITISHLLNMMSGLDCDESPGNQGRNHEHGVDEGPNPFSYALAIGLSDQPGSKFSYCNANSFLIAAAVSAALKRAGKQTIFEFAHRHLFEPLEINKDQYRLRTSPDLRFLMGQGNSNFTPRDLAKFGLLVLNDGRYKSKQILSSASIAKIKNAGPLINWKWADDIKAIANWPNYYSHQWYHTDFSFKDQRFRSIHSWGNGGQFIFVLPELELVVVFTGSNQGSNYFRQQKQPFKIIQSYIIPHIIKYSQATL